MTLNKDTKTPDGCIGFSTNVDAVKRWEIKAAYRAALRTCFHKHRDYQPQKYKHDDLNSSRIMQGEKAVQCILSVIATTYIDPLSPLQLMSVSTGVLAAEKVASGMSSAKEKGETVFYTFVKNRLNNEKTMCIFDPMKKNETFDLFKHGQDQNMLSQLKDYPCSSKQGTFCQSIFGCLNSIIKYEICI